MQHNSASLQTLAIGVLAGFFIGYVYFTWRSHSLKERLPALEKEQYPNSVLPIQKYPDGDTQNGLLLFSDTFDDNVNNWDTQLKSYGMKILYNGKYILDYREDGYFWWSSMPMKREAMNYTITLKCKHISGSADGYYGLIMTSDSANYHRFCLTGNGYASINVKEENKWQADMARYLGGFTPVNAIVGDVLVLKVRGIRFTYLANGKKVYSGTLNSHVSWKNLGMFVEDKQTVEFDEIYVTEDD